MREPEVMSAESWLEAIAEEALKPDLIDEVDSEARYSRAWSREHNGNRYVYYEEGVHGGLPLRALIGSVAVEDLDGLDAAGAEDRLLSAAISPVPGREEAKTALKRLMGIRGPDKAKATIGTKRAEAGDWPNRFVLKFSHFSRLEREEVEELGLVHFRSAPFFSRRDNSVYLVSREDLDDDWPALRYGVGTGRWQYRLLAAHDVLSLSGFEDQDYKAQLLSGHGWYPIGTDQIKRISAKLAEKKLPNSR